MAFNIETALENLNERYAEVTDLVPDIFYFYDESDGGGEGGNTNRISDGGEDMYDGGNAIFTETFEGGEPGNEDDRIPYTHTQFVGEIEDEFDNFIPYVTPPMDGTINSGNSYFGSGSSYFTNMYPGLFVMVASDCNITRFEINGNIGSDGDGTVEVHDFAINLSGKNYAVFFKANGNTDDPSINHIIIVPNGTGIVHTYDDDSEDDEDIITSESNMSRVYYLLIAKRTAGEESNGVLMSQEEAEAVATKFINIVEGTRPTFTISPVVTFEVIGYNLADIINSGPLADTLENTINSLNRRTVWIETVGAYRNGDQFTVFGQQAHYLKKLYVSVEKPTLKIISWT